MSKLLSNFFNISSVTGLLAVLWIIIKWVLRLSLYYLLFYIVYVTYNTWWLKEDYNYLTFDTGSPGIRGQIRIPKDIVQSRDCDALYRWQHRFVPRDLQGLCPWAEVRDKRKVGMADLWFDFPRKYLSVPFQPVFLKDGLEDGVLGGWNYPDMTVDNKYEKKNKLLHAGY